MAFQTRIKFEANTVGEVRTLFRQFARFAPQEAAREFERFFQPYREEMRKRSKEGPLFKNTGRLSGSYDREITGGTALSQLRASVFSRSSYAPVHELGGMVYPPRGSSWIFIPTVYNTLQTIRGKIRRARYSVRQVRSAGGRFVSLPQFLRDYPDDATKTLQIMDYVTRSMLVNAEGVPMFTQVKRARYEARLGFFEVGKKYEALIIEALANGFAEYWDEAA